GLMPRLTPGVAAVYVEATPDDTEGRLLRALRKLCPGLPEDADLVAALAHVRRERGLPDGRKLVLFLDQFEQWLHARPLEPAAALRQCDGGNVQAVLLVRDDFWMSIIRFTREVEVPLVEGQNSAAVDLFSARHARKVLAAFGRAFGALPEGSFKPEEDRFLD